MTTGFWPVPEWVPAVDGFWKPDGRYAGWSDRKAWMGRLPTSIQRCSAACLVRRSLHLFEKRPPTDVRPRHAIDIAERFAFGLASDSERKAAAAAAAAYADAYADAAAYAAAYAAADAYADAAAYAAAYAAADAAADAAAYAAAYAAAAADAERVHQTRLLSLFVLPDRTRTTEAARGLVAGWLDKWWGCGGIQGTDDRLTRGILADELEYHGLMEGWRLTALRELDHWSIGMYPMVPPDILDTKE